MAVSKDGRSSLLLMDGEAGGRRRLWFITWVFPGACLALSISALAIFALPLGILAALALRHRSGLP